VAFINNKNVRPDEYLKALHFSIFVCSQACVFAFSAWRPLASLVIKIFVEHCTGKLIRIASQSQWPPRLPELLKMGLRVTKALKTRITQAMQPVDESLLIGIWAEVDCLWGKSLDTKYAPIEHL
jgi:hypothetical protein